MELLIDTTTNITSLGISDNGIMKSEKIWVSERKIRILSPRGRGMLVVSFLWILERVIKKRLL